MFAMDCQQCEVYGYTLLLAMRSWKFEAVSAFRR